jgi:hypothetical protein
MLNLNDLIPGTIHVFLLPKEIHMRPTLKHLIVMLVVVLAGGMTLSAQHRDGGRLPRILDPLGILPTPRQVLRTLDHAGRILPPVVIEPRGYPFYDYDYGCDYPRYPVRRYARDYRYERYEHRGHHPAPIRPYGHDRSRDGWRR